MLRRCARGAVPSLCRWVTSTTWQPGSTASRPWTSSRSLEAIPLRSRSTGSRAASVFTDVWTPDAGARASSRKEKSHSRDDARISRDAPSRTRDRLAPRQEFERDLRLARDVFDALEAGDRLFHRTGTPLTVAQASLAADRRASLPLGRRRRRRAEESNQSPQRPFPPSTPPLPENPERVAFRERLVADPRFVAMLDRATVDARQTRTGRRRRLARPLGATLTRCGCVLPAEAWRTMCEGARAKAGEMSAEELARVVWALGSAARGNRDAFYSRRRERLVALESAMARVARDMTRARARDTLVHYLRIVEAGAAFGGACEERSRRSPRGSRGRTSRSSPSTPRRGWSGSCARTSCFATPGGPMNLRPSSDAHVAPSRASGDARREAVERARRRPRRRRFVEAIGARARSREVTPPRGSSCTTSIALCGGGDARSRARRPSRTRASRDAPARTRRGANDVVANA